MERRPRLLSPPYAATTIGMFSLIAFAAFEAMAVTTVMPTVSDELGGLDLYALAFAAPLAGSVIGMVVAGLWTDRRGAAGPLVAGMALFALGLVIAGAAPTMEVLVAGRLVQGVGSGVQIVALYVLVGLVFPAVLQPAVFASFAAAWVLPALFGPGLAALVAAQLGWRWVFLGTVGLVLLAAALVAPALRRLGDGGPGQAPSPGATPRSRLWWASVAALSVLALELLGSGPEPLLALVPLVLVVMALRRLLPTGSLIARPGLPSVILTRGLLSAGFFVGEAYIVFVLQADWGLTPGQAGIALTVVGVVWALGSQAQSRVGDRLSHPAMMRLGTLTVLAGLLLLATAVWLHLHPALAAGGYAVAGAGMGLGYPRTGVAMLAASTGADRGFNSSALTIADAVGAALAIAVAGVAFGLANQAGLDPFRGVFVLAVLCAVGAVVAAGRTAGDRPSPAATEQ